jgi:hypothetical protein
MSLPETQRYFSIAVQKLTLDQRAVLDRLWTDARTGHEKRLCEQAANTTQAEKQTYIDWDACQAISADHSVRRP